MKNGLTHVYTGDGKGKTTAAMGMALRAAGCGLTVRIYQFCKASPSGEVQALSAFERVTLRRAACETNKFPADMTPEEKAAWLDAQQSLFDEACESAADKDADLVILDEALGAMHEGVMDARQLVYLVKHKNPGTELVFTGRAAPAALIEAADYVTEMRLVKHPYQRGTHARKGIEY